MQYGFVIDHSKCIGCHACTVACKSENDVPLGDFRTWVKYTETGTFPQVKRHFAVLRCNQCTDAPCVTICPVHALHKREDGIVDVDPERCIGCKGCMQACPYDALYINGASGTAEKCHFCAHRTEAGLAPACAVVCPTEAIIPGDFHDPDSRVSKLRDEGGLTARKTEAGTGPNVLYREADAGGLDPGATNKAGGYLWANQVSGVQMDAQTWEAAQTQAESRTTYDVEHPPLWGGKVFGYLFTKSLAAGLFLAAYLADITAFPSPAVVLGSLFFLAVTAALLVGDLKRPQRFWFILRYPNWSSWITKGAVILTAYGAFLAVTLIPGLTGRTPWLWGLVGGILAVLTAAYTGWLFRQAKGRVLWMRPLMALELTAHAWLAGNAALILASPWVEAGPAVRALFRLTLPLVAALTLSTDSFVPWDREKEFHRATRLVNKGPFAKQHWIVGFGVGLVVPVTLVNLVPHPAAWPVAAALALVGLYWEQRIVVRAGQALPIS